MTSSPTPSMGAPSPWTPEREARATRLYLHEGFSAAQVAEALGSGISRAAVCGKMKRLGLAKERLPSRIGERLDACATSRISAFRRPPAPLPHLSEVGPTGSPATLADAEGCRWLIDDPGPGRMHLALCCNGPVQGDGPYCSVHHARAWKSAA